MTRITKLGRKQHEEASGFVPPAPGASQSLSGRRPGLKGSTEYKEPAADARQRQKREARRQRRIRERQTDTFCFNCRQSGHRVAQCPSANQGQTSICYRCGSLEHTLKACTRPRRNGDNGREVLEYAQCFICREMGHLTAVCPENAHGKFPKGGHCKVCGENDHLARDCPKLQSTAATVAETGADDDAYHTIVARADAPPRRRAAPKPKRKVITF